MKKNYVVALWLTFSISNVMSQTLSGNFDCAQWVKMPTVAKPWLLGYLSGINTMTADMKANPPKDPLAKATPDQSFMWMDNYCKTNPLEKVSAGALKLYIELIQR